jgi:hypothetical protein
MSGEYSNTLSLEGIPNVAVKVIIPCKEKTPRYGKGDRGDTTKNIVMGELIKFTISTKIE